MRLEGRVAVVTGAGGGIGAAIARALAKEGCRLALVDVAEGPLRAVGAEIPGSTTHVVDVSNADAMKALADEVIAAHGGAHVLINNAGTTVVGSFVEHSAADWDRVMGVNLMGAVNGCRAFLPHLAKADEAWIVNLSSLFGLMGVPGQTAYCASKFAVRGFSEALAGELAGTHIGVTVVHPGGVRTSIIANAKAGDGVADGSALLEKLKGFFDKNAAPPEVAANAIVGALKAGRTRVRICRETYFLDWIVRFAPVWGHRTAVGLIRKAMGVDKDIQERQAKALSAK
jgi:NAD(P)-dependent dehydrogenase (short-subunit alcohol dehydrogenase family)